MELKQLERFLAVVDHGTLAAAARALSLTQQGLSASLAGLEKGLDLRLFDRGPGGVTRLTDYGAALVPHARSQLAADRRARQELGALRDAQAGTVTVGIGETFSGDIIATAVQALHRERPGLRINLVEGYSESILTRLYSGEFDFAAVGVGGFALEPGYRAEHIYTANDVVACRSGHPLTRRTRIGLADLASYTWVVPYSRPSDLDVIAETFVRAGEPAPQHVIGSDAYRIGMKLLAATDFLLMTSPALVTSHLARKAYGLAVLPVDRPTVTRNASLVYSEARPMTPAGQRLLVAVRDAAADYDAGGRPAARNNTQDAAV